MLDVIGRARRLQRRVSRRLPLPGRRRRLHPAFLSAPAVVLAGAAAAGLLLWDERRRSAMRRRMEHVAGSVGTSVSSSLNRRAPTTPPAPAGVGRD